MTSLSRLDTTFKNGDTMKSMTSIVEVRRLDPVNAATIQTPKMKKREICCKLVTTLFGELLGRCLLLGLCALTIWRLTLSDPSFPHWGFAILSIGILLSLVDCLQSTWYKSKIYGYWHFYKYIHWSGRTWFDPNTLFCLATIVPTLACTELAAFNMHQSELQMRSPQQLNDFTTPSNLNSSISVPTSYGSGADFNASTTIETITPPSTTPDPFNSNSTDAPVNFGVVPIGRDLSLYTLHNVVCIVVVLVRLLIRKPEGIPSARFNLLIIEMAVHAIDLSVFIVNGLDQTVALSDRAVFTSVVVVWAVGFLTLILVVSRRFAEVEYDDDRKKLETLYCVILTVFQEIPRLTMRVIILVLNFDTESIGSSYILLFACKNALFVLLFFHRICLSWNLCSGPHRRL